ncbi:hypothetical protein G6F57_001507 [Rhizopus arrhizus]|uniref:Uncharacterized protein n=1 Tax=Rhizopus oryzae TaxID=64495 RepID=A0A9P6X968_RHIOR|nr:hypothetical protein G6F22_009725 [Rhizopus arrhizus]KAG0789068.1 hypothetical protein G6F21_006766 [Rhizopus arrhizus]KAG0835380.1 hypothetical protein G6F18_005863 [Rhizopus arrhizus]KAG0840237.1 hypothetical protein G6F19_002156 [Rhizopus arrhizus]KAG0859058.1 hypothetical protein G6F17_002256 [Rhizopus arrhizus]
MNSLQSKFKSFSISASDSKNKSSEKSQLTSNPSQKKILDDLETTPKSVLRAKLKKLPKTQVNMKKGNNLPSANSVQTKNWTKMLKILPQRYYGFQTASDILKTMMKRKRITSPQELRSRFNKQGLKNQLLEEPLNENVVDSTREVKLAEALDAEDVPMETKNFFYSEEGEEDTGLLVVPRTISVASASFKPLSSLYLSKPRIVEHIMNDINENDTTSRYLTTGEAFELFKHLQIEERAQRDENLHGSDLSLWISEYLDGTLMYELKGEFKRFKRQVTRYNNDTWNRQEQINKELIPELKQWKIDTFQIVNNIYKYSEDTSVQARANTEIYEQSYYLQKKIQFNNEEDKHIFEGAVDQAAKLAAFGFRQAKF